MGEEMEIRAVEERPYWETISCKDIESIVLGNIYTQERAAKTLINSAVAAGYYLRRQRDEKMYLEQGYNRFEDYVKERYGKSPSWASRQIDMNKAFSIDGNDPRADEKWLEFGKSQLQEMLYLTDKQREQVTPGMTVREIREIRKPEPVPEPIEEAPVDVVICEAVELEMIPELPPAPEAPLLSAQYFEGSMGDMFPDMEEDDEEELLCDACVNASAITGDPALCSTCTSEGRNYRARCITGQSGSGFCGGAAYCSEPYTCCAQCGNDCNSRCGWLEESNKADGHTRDQAEYAVAAMSDPKIDFKALDQMISAAKDAQEQKKEAVAMSQETDSARKELCESGGCPPEIDHCIREEWGDSPKERHIGQRECAECWRTYMMDQKTEGKAQEEVVAAVEPQDDLDQVIVEPKHDEAWFVGRWAETFPGKCDEIMDRIRGMANGEKAKAVQKHMAPCGYSGGGCSEYDYEFYGFTSGIKLRFGSEKIRLKYGRFVKELEALHQREVATSQEIREGATGEAEKPKTKLGKKSGLVSEMACCARNSLGNAQSAIGANAWKAALTDARHLVHYLEVIVREIESEGE